MSAEGQELESQGKKSIEHLKKDLQSLRTGRASTSSLETVHVDYYGSRVPLQQMGLLATPEPRLITIQVFDASAIEAVEKAIQQADLGFNPSREGSLLRIVVPQLTEERRKEQIKKAHKIAEETRIGLRNNRREILEGLKKKQKDKEVTEDEARRVQDEIEKVMGKFSKEIDVLVASKEKELMEI
jgi:ribosome recycling factor